MQTVVGKKELRKFRNPVGKWRHVGSFEVKVGSGFDMSVVPDTAEVNGSTITVKSGEVRPAVGFLQMYSSGRPLFLGYPQVLFIRNGEGKLLWVNENYRSQI